MRVSRSALRPLSIGTLLAAAVLGSSIRGRCDPDQPHMLAVHKQSAAAAEATLPTTGTAPLTRTVIVGSANEISAGDQMIGATPYTFSSWSDGSAGQHVITATTAIRPTRRRSRGPSTPVAKLSAGRTWAGLRSR